MVPEIIEALNVKPDGVYADGTDIENNNWFAFLNGENAIPYSGSSSGKTKTGVVILTIGAKQSQDAYSIYGVCSEIAKGVNEQNLVE